MDRFQGFPLVSDIEIRYTLRAHLVKVEQAEPREAVVDRYNYYWMVFLD